MKIAVLGLGYVGLPLATALAKHYKVIGFDVDKKRIEELKTGFDRTHELSEKELQNSSLQKTHTLEDLKGCKVYIVTVPTPVHEDTNMPDLTLLKVASEMIGQVMESGAIVVYESTVYPGVTEDYCGPVLEKASGLKIGQDFFLGYSPERINPGDKEHTVYKITKVVAGQTPDVCETLAKIYGTITTVFKAANIKTAEAAKVIENAQRDINIAFMNEITAIFNKDGISIYDVLEAAQTKWNFLPFQPGLVGGHCIGVDPFYLANYAQQKGHHPEVILAGRHMNDSMASIFGDFVHQHIKQRGIQNKKVLILGLTFKENIPDLRNTKVVDLVSRLEKLGYDVDVTDPHANPHEAKKYYGMDLKDFDDLKGYDCIVGTVPHDQFKHMTEKDFARIGNDECLVVDLKNMWKHHKGFPAGFLKVSI
ncbi:MAG: nucleotide sugar dehydrogenase [Alphaproteobacteria bacterium]